jgi:hypothetical protein
MITVNNTTKNLIKRGSSIKTSASATMEYNLNSMVEYIKATTTPAEIVNAYSAAFKKLFPIDTIYKPFRPVSPGIKYLVYTKDASGNQTDSPRQDLYENPRDVAFLGKPRLYYPGPEMTYKYWLAPKNTNISVSLEYFSNEAKTTVKLVPANKIIARFETNHDTPLSWTISVVKEDNSVVNVTGTSLNENGEAVIYYDGTAWSTDDPDEYTTTQKLKKITLSATNRMNGKLLGVIEFSPRWVVDISSDIVSFTVNKETTADSDSVVPVGVITANYLSLSLFRQHGETSRSVMEYNVKDDIDDTKLYLFKNAIIKPYVNIGDVNPEKVTQGIFYANSWTLSEFGEATIDATDAAKILQDTVCPQLLVQDSPVTSVIKRVLDAVGFSNYNINIKMTDGEVDDDSIPSLAYWWCDGDKTVWEVLQELCRDIQMNAFVNENNILNFYSRNVIYDADTPSSWVFTDKEITSGGVVDYAPSIASLSSREMFSANQVTVKYSSASTSVNSTSSQPLWTSSDSFLGAGRLDDDIEDSSTMFKLKPNTINKDRIDKVLDAFSGYVLINDEIIEYDGLWYQYVPKEKDYSFDPPRDKPAVRVLMKSQSDFWKYEALAKPGSKYFFPTGEYNIKTRGALGTLKNKRDHKKQVTSYINGVGENDANKFKSYSVSLGETAITKWTGGNLTAPANPRFDSTAKNFLMVSSLVKDKKQVNLLIKPFNTINTGSLYMACGTRMFFDSQLVSPAQVGGIAFCLDSTGQNGYYVLIRTTAYAVLENDIMIVKVQNGKITVLKDSQQTSPKTLAGIYAGQSYNIDVLVKSQTTSGTLVKNTITVFINGFKIRAVDAGSDSTNQYIPPLTITKNIAVHCGRGMSYFDFLYGKSIDEALYNERSTVSSYKHVGSYADDTISMLYGDLIYNNGNTVADQNGALIEFGTTAREIRKVKIAYDPDERPALPIMFRTSKNPYATVLDQRLQPFSAETYILNNTSTSVVLHDSDYTTFYVLGNKISRSSAIEYNTDQSEDSQNKESVIFESSWIQNEQDAEKLANWIKTNSLNKGRFVDMTVFGNPLISAGDIVSIKYPILGMSESSAKYLVTKCTLEYSEGITTTISCRAI